MKRRARITSGFRRRPRHARGNGKAKVPENIGLQRGANGDEAARKTMSQRNDRLQILSDCLARLLPQRKTEKIVADIFPQVAAHVGADAFFNYLAVPEPHGLDLLTLAGISAGAVCKICDACSGGALHCQAAQTRKTVASYDIQLSNDPKLSHIRALGIQTCLCIPLLIGERLLGVLSFASRTKPQFAPDEIDFLQLIAGHVAIAMDRALSEELLRDHGQRLQIALETAKMGMWELEIGSELHVPLTDAELRKIRHR